VLVAGNTQEFYHSSPGIQKGAERSQRPLLYQGKVYRLLAQDGAQGHQDTKDNQILLAQQHRQKTGLL
jgi:hypothetical protein